MRLASLFLDGDVSFHATRMLRAGEAMHLFGERHTDASMGSTTAIV